MAADMAVPGLAAEVFYPSLVKGSSLLETYPIMIWHQPWLSPDSILHWPSLIDIDQRPFTQWQKRIPQ